MLSWLVLPIVIPLLAAALLTVVPHWRIAAWINLAATTLTFAAAIRLIWVTGVAEIWLWADRLAVHMTVVTGLLAFGAALYAPIWLGRELSAWRLPESAVHRHLALFQTLLAALLLALLARDPALTWVGLVAAVLAMSLCAALPGTPAAHILSRTLLGFGAIGLLLALLGMILVQFATAPVLPTGEALGWDQIQAAAPRADGALLGLGFVLVLVGGTTIAGIAVWPPGPETSPLTGLFGVAMAAVVLVLLLRLRGILAGHAGALPHEPIILGLGVLALLIGAGACARSHVPRRVLDHATVAHLGLAVIAIGLGGAGGSFVGLLHLSLLVVARVALLPVAALAGFEASNRTCGLTFAAGLLALAALPPFGLFASLFLLLVELLRSAPLLAVPVGGAVLVLAWSLLAQLPALLRPAPGPSLPPWELVPAWVLLALLAGLGFAMPDALTAWFNAIVQAIP